MQKPSRRQAGVLLAVAFVAGAPIPTIAENGAIMIAIDNMPVGHPPLAFTFARTGQGGPSQWIVAADATVPAGRVIEQTSTDRADYRFPLAIYDAHASVNLAVELRFKAVGGRIDQAAGIAVRLRDPDNYYVVRANALEDNVRFYRVIKGRREQLEGANLKVAANEWHNLGLRAEGDRFTVAYDGKALFTASDRSITEAGKVALWTKSDSVTRFDQIRITAMP